jgi:hypothetical protein
VYVIPHVIIASRALPFIILHSVLSASKISPKSEEPPKEGERERESHDTLASGTTVHLLVEPHRRGQAELDSSPNEVPSCWHRGDVHCDGVPDK